MATTGQGDGLLRAFTAEYTPGRLLDRIIEKISDISTRTKEARDELARLTHAEGAAASQMQQLQLNIERLEAEVRLMNDLTEESSGETPDRTPKRPRVEFA